MFISTDNDAWVKCNGVCNRDSRKVQTPANGGTVTFEKEYKLVGEEFHLQKHLSLILQKQE